MDVSRDQYDSGPPVREPAVDEKTNKQMMAYYYKKQEQQKARDMMYKILFIEIRNRRY